MKVKLMNENFKSRYLDNILMSRGIREEDLVDYKCPTKKLLSEPDKLLNIQGAAAVIIKGASDNKKFALIADCDVDGLTSATVIYSYMKEQWPNCQIDFFNHDGKQHGLSDMVEQLINGGYDIVLEPDAGINDCKYHDYLGEAGMLTVVMDHHEYEGGGFSDYALYVDNQISPDYPNKSLSGVGVTWQVCRYIDKLAGTDYAFKYIDLVALGCCADVMSTLTLENRFIFHYGFSHLENPMFKALCEKQAYSMNNEVNYTSVAFYIAPLLNACMRSGTQAEKERMYKSFIKPLEKVETQKRGHAPGELVALSTEVCRELTNIKARQGKLIEKYEADFEFRIQSQALDENNIIFIQLTDKDNFSSELNGLIAMRLAAAHKKPVLIGRASLLDGQTKGSMRNPDGSPIDSLKELISESPYTAFVAGHASAAGYGIETAHIDDFIDWFNRKTADMDFREDCVDANFERTPNSDDLDALIYEIGEYTELWGGDNKLPVININNIRVPVGNISVCGKNMDTIRFTVNGVTYIKFCSKDLANEIFEHNEDLNISICGTPNINEWAGRQTPQIMITDIEFKDDDICEF